MPHLSESYHAYPQDVQQAEGIMSDEQKYLSQVREKAIEQWEPSQTKTSSEMHIGESNYHRSLRDAESRGEHILDLQVNIILRIPAGLLLNAGEWTIENAIDDAGSELKSQVIEHIAKDYPELVQDSVVYKSNMAHLHGMLDATVRDGQTHLYDSVEAKRLLRECKDLEEKYGHAHDSEVTYWQLLNRFSKIGEVIHESS